MKFAFGCSCGASALIMALLALEIGKGDEVLVQTNGFIADLEAIYFSGATPVFLEVDPKTFWSDLKDLKQKITPRSKALLLIHMYGHSCKMDEILEICEKYGLILIEDASHAHSAEYKGKKVGTFGKVGCFSCGPVKNLNAVGDAGVVVTDDDEIAFKLKYLRVHRGGFHYGLKRIFEVLRDLITFSFVMRNPQFFEKFFKYGFFICLSVGLLFSFLMLSNPDLANIFLELTILSCARISFLIYKNLKRFNKAQKEGVFIAEEL